MKELNYITLLHEDYLYEDCNLLPGVIRIGELGCRITTRNTGFTLPSEREPGEGLFRIHVEKISQNFLGTIILKLYDPSIGNEFTHILHKESVTQSTKFLKLFNVTLLTLIVASIGTLAAVVGTYISTITMICQ